MKNVYEIMSELLHQKHNQPIEMSLTDLIDELEKVKAVPDETIFQMKLALLHYDQELINIHNTN